MADLKVFACSGCPFRLMEPGWYGEHDLTCFLDEQQRDVTPPWGAEEKGFPEWCPLRGGKVTVEIDTADIDAGWANWW